ncbi:MAG TPA: ABATE domain-containing protein [Gemmatimonadales bacterium]|nr:ABATE domain-containing protein [Gemmatimonadales bacterium]
MTAASLPPPVLPLKYVGGDPSLDLVNTVDWTAEGRRNERLTDYARLLVWAEGAGVASRGTVRRLDRLARRRPRAAAAALAEAHRVRDTLRRVFARVADGERPTRELAELNTALAAALAHLELMPGGRGRPAFAWRGTATDLRAPLWPVVWAAARLLASDEAARLRVCGGADCGWMYVDRSRNRLRRWCEMETCGTRAKSRRRRERRRSKL